MGPVALSHRHGPGTKDLHTSTAQLSYTEASDRKRLGVKQKAQCGWTCQSPGSTIRSYCHIYFCWKVSLKSEPSVIRSSEQTYPIQAGPGNEHFLGLDSERPPERSLGSPEQGSHGGASFTRMDRAGVRNRAAPAASSAMRTSPKGPTRKVWEQGRMPPHWECQFGPQQQLGSPRAHTSRSTESVEPYRAPQERAWRAAPLAQCVLFWKRKWPKENKNSSR